MTSSTEAGRDLYVDLRPESDVLVVAFAGLAEEMGIPAFEFMNLLAGLDVQSVLVRDSRRIWYQHGVAGVGGSVDAVADHLAERIAAIGPRRVVFVGSSAGGYAAILFSALVPAHKVIAFGPQTFIDPDLRATHGDTRWEPATTALRKAGGPEPRYADLRALLDLSAGERPSIDVHYSDQADLDALHAERLEGLPDVEIIAHPAPSHNVPAFLKRRKRLAALITASLEAPE